MSARESMVLPLTSAQLTLWFDETYLDDCGLHTMGDCLDIRGPVDLDRLLRALHLTINEADAARARYLLVDNRPMQELAETVEIPVEWFEFKEDLTPDERVTLAWDDMNQRMDRRMDITRPPLMYVVLYPIAPMQLLILMAMHHIVADGYSRVAIYERWRELYDGGPDAGSPLPPLTTLLDAESQYRAGPALAADELYWKREVATLPERVSLSVGGSEPGRVRMRETITLEPAHARRLREGIEHAGLSWSAALTASSLLYVAKFMGRDHVQVTFPVTARTTRAVRRTPGMIANYPPLVARVEPADTVESFIRSVGKAVLRTIKHQRYRVQSIRALAGFHQSDHVAFGPYVNVIPQEPVLRFGEATLTLQNVSTGFVDDLMFTFMQAADGGLDIHVNGNPALHSAAQVKAHAARLGSLLRRALSDPSAVVADLPLLAPGDPAIANDAGPEGSLSVPGVVESIHRVAMREPDRTAIRDDEGEVSYCELAIRADAIARSLRPGVVAAVLAPPGRYFVTALVAALQAGAAWTPVDIDSPRERQLTLIGDSGASAILTTAEYLAQARELAAATGADVVIQLDGPRPSISPEDIGTLAVHPANPDSVAYIMFTSGTTGRPKGAMVHRARLLNHLLAKVELLDLGGDDAVMQNAPVTFDVSVWQMLAPLLCGGVTRPVTRSTAANPTAIAEIISSARLTQLELVPSFLRVALEFFDATGVRPFDVLKSLMVTGEALPPDLCEAVHARYPSLPIINAYGPTECSDDVAHAVITADRKLGLRTPIGTPIRNTRLLVLGPDLLPVPDGVVGELYVAGPCVGPGYLADPVKTARAFTALPGLAPGERAYRTGDYVVRNPLGELEFVERRDHQVKINGQRIELGEVEAGLRNLGPVADAVASVVQAGGAARLAGHIVLRGPAPADLDGVMANLLSELSQRVPANLVPSLWSVLDELPLTAHGKVDRKALPDGSRLRPATVSGHEVIRTGGATRRPSDRGPSDQDQSGQGPSDPVAGHEPAAATASDRDGEIGGDGEIDRDLDPAGGAPDAGDEAAMSVPLVPTPIQRQLADETGDVVEAIRGYCQFVRFATPPRLTVADVDRLMARLTRVHPMLAVRLDREPGGWHLSQRAFGVNGWTSPSQGDAEVDLAQAVSSLDLERGIVWRGVLDADAQTLLLAIHHLVVDGVSWRILQSDLADLAAGNEPQPERSALRDWAVDQLEAAHHPLVADLSQRLWTADRRQPTTSVAAGAPPVMWADSQVHTTRLTTPTIAAFLTCAQTVYGVHINDLFLAALGLALAAQPDFVGDRGVDARVDIEVEGHGREDISSLLADGRLHELGRTVGWFTTNYPVSVCVRAASSSDAAWTRSLVADVHEQTSAMIAHGLTYGLSRWLDTRTAATLARRPIPSIGFNYLGRFRADSGGGKPFALLPAAEGGDAIGTAVAGPLPLRHRLEVTPVVWDTAEGPQLVTAWRYDATSLTAGRVERLASAWHDALAAVVAAGGQPSPGARHAIPDSSDRRISDAQDARERWRAHLFGLSGGAPLGGEATGPARPDSLAIDLPTPVAASLADVLASGRVDLLPLVYVAWAGNLAECSEAGEAVLGVELLPEGGEPPLGHPSGSPAALLPLRVRVRPHEDADGLVSRIGTELRVLRGAARLSLAEVLDAVVGPVPERILDSAVIFRETLELGTPPPACVEPASAPERPGEVLTLVATPRGSNACDFALHLDTARLTRQEAAAHASRFVACLAELLSGRLPAALCPSVSAGARIRPPRRAEGASVARRDPASSPVPAETIAMAMAHVLGHEQVGLDDSFFALGGDSISVISLASELRAAGHEVHVRDIYRYRTPRELADAAPATGAEGPAAPPPVAPEDFPASEPAGNLLHLDDDELVALEAELGF